MRYFKIGIICFGFIVFFSGCKPAKTNSGNSSESYIYVMDYEEDNIEREAYSISDGTPEKQITNMLKALENKPQNVDNKSLLGGKVKIRSFQLEEDKLTVDFDEGYEKLSKSEELLLRAGMVQSLLQIEQIHMVQFTIQGKLLKTNAQSGTGWMTADTFVQNTGSSFNTYTKADLILYFADEKGEKLAWENKTIRYNSNVSVEKLVVEELIKGPDSQGLLPTLDSGTQVLGVTIKDGVCYVNFDKSFWELHSKVRPKLVIYSIVNSLTDSADVSRVEILMNGETVEKYEDTIDISKPLSRNMKLVKEE